ncbi:aspartoacylase [Sulfurospirillum sp. 1612]|uniref:aspartoacylase n=1 Tax=Sulfurospirillum sp. 1612 TaxID=3094835 RepID=UPI002F9311E8
MRKIKTVAITGGTHGNELTGVYLIKKFFKNPDLVKRSNFETLFMHTNLGAMKQCTRYVDKDLNRTFVTQDLADPSRCTYEDILAKNLNEKLGPKGSKNPHVDFIVDLHSTTSDMGLSIIIDNDSPLVWKLAAYLSVHEPKLHIFRWKGDTAEVSFVNSIAPNGFAIEVGPIPQGVLRADLFFETETLVQKILDFFEKYNNNTLETLPKEIEIYNHIKLVDFPRDKKGEIKAAVHPNLQDHGYIKVQKGDPLFIDLEGRVIYYEEEADVYALFINEAAYYEKGFAMCFAEKKTIKVS